MDIIGLPLPDAVKLLPAAPTITETAPPFVSKTRIPIWGELRVVRVVEREGGVELLVARELLGEDKIPVSP